MRFIDILKNNATVYKDKIAIVDSNPINSITYFYIEKMSNKIANKLSKLGYGTDDKIIVNLERSALYFIAELGILKINASFIPVMTTYPKDRIQYI